MLPTFLFVNSGLIFLNIVLFQLDIILPLNTAVVLGSICCLCSVIYAIERNDGRMTFSTVLLLYTIATQYGLIIPYALLGDSVLSEYSSYTLRFLNDEYNLVRSTYLANVAILAFVIPSLFIKIKEFYSPEYQKEKISNYENDICLSEESDLNQKTKIVGGILLGTVFFYFVFYILSGGMQLFSTYEEFRSSAAFNSSIYSSILVLFYVGTIYLAASGKVKDNKYFWFLWLIIVLIFALNGNKGEFMYSLLAVIGLRGVKGEKISLRLLIGVGLILFIIIPFITLFRSIGIVDNISNISFNFFDAFVEMGMQIRTSVYLLEDISNGTQQLLLGRSYYQPVLNIILFFLPTSSVATLSIKARYPGYGFTQVIESYTNFGIFGTLIYFVIVGSLISKYENKDLDTLQLVLLGNITSILINATRNYFAFVPGQILIVTIIYFLTKYFKIFKSP